MKGSEGKKSLISPSISLISCKKKRKRKRNAFQVVSICLHDSRLESWPLLLLLIIPPPPFSTKAIRSSLEKSTREEKMSFQDLEAGKGGRSRKMNGGGGRQDSTQAVASGIFQINTGVSTFQRLVNTLGTPKDTPELRDKLYKTPSFFFFFFLMYFVFWMLILGITRHKTRLHIGQLVMDTSAKLKEASETDHRTRVNVKLI